MKDLKFFTVNEFAEKFQLCPTTIRNAIKKGRINAFRVGAGTKAAYRIPETEIERIAIMDYQQTIKNIRAE